MRRLVGLAILAAVGCSRSKPKPLQGIRLVYELDLEAAIDDRMSELKRDVAAGLADQKIDATLQLAATNALLTVTPTDPANYDTTAALLRRDYRDTMTVVECKPGLCLQPSDPSSIRNAALDRAVTAIRTRIDQLHVSDPSVVSKGEQIIIDVPGDPKSPELVAVRNLIARGGKLEMKVVDDCADPPPLGCTQSGAHTGSPYMKRLAAFVGTDKGAEHDHVRVDVETWTPEEGGGRHTDYYLRADDRDAIEHYLGDLARSDPSFKLPDDHQLGFERVIPQPDAKDPHPYWRTYYLERATRMTGADIASASSATDPNTNRPLVMLDFGHRGGTIFGDLTSQIVGMKLVTILDGTVKSAPIINGAIRGGRASITMGGNDAAAATRERDELVTVLKSGALPAPLREISMTIVGPPSGN